VKTSVTGTMYHTPNSFHLRNRAQLKAQAEQREKQMQRKRLQVCYCLRHELREMIVIHFPGI
jgi:hypothetical protein